MALRAIKNINYHVIILKFLVPLKIKEGDYLNYGNNGIENEYVSTNKIQLFPTPQQAQILDKCIEAYPIVYNWALAAEYQQFDDFNNEKTERSFLSFYDLIGLYKDFRKTNPLLMEVPTHSMYNAINDMVRGYESFFRHKDLFNKPKFKSNKKEVFSSYKPRSEWNSFYFVGNLLRVEGLPYQNMIVTSFNTNATLLDHIRYIGPIIFRNNRTNEYFCNYGVSRPKLVIDGPKSGPIGVDVNRQKMYACSDGTIINMVDTCRIEQHISDMNKVLEEDRKRYKEILKENPVAKQSNNMIYHLEKNRKLYQKISNIHKNTAYQGSLEIIRKNPSVVIIEDLDIKQMMQTSYIADDLFFHPLGIALQILQDQCFKYDIPVIKAPKGFQSSNFCSFCGAFKDIKSNKYFDCPRCTLHIDRDINAAANLRNWYINFKLQPDVQ